MKKILSVILCLLLACSLLTACGSKPGEESGDSTVTEAADLNLADVVAAIETVAPVAMAQELSPAVEGSNDFMTDLFGFDMSTVEDYYGKTTMVNVSSDVIMVVKAAPGQIDAVKATLEARRDAVAASFEMYLPDQYEKALAGRVVTKGDYALLVIGGDGQRVTDEGVEAVYAEIDEAIDTALNG